MTEEEKRIEKLEIIVTSDPENEEALFELGMIYYFLADYNRAIDYFSDITSRNAHHFEALFNLGNCYYVLRNFVEAIYYFKQSFYVEPNNSEAYYNLALAYLYNDELDNGEKLLLDYNNLYKEENAKVYLLLAKIYSLKEMVERALEYLSKAISIDPILKQLAADSEFDNIKDTLEFKDLM